MKRIFAAVLLGTLVLGGVGSGYAQGTSKSTSAIGQRDYVYEQYLKQQASADAAITPARVLRWMRGMTDATTRFQPVSNVEFQPILNVHDSQKEIVAQIAYKFF